MLINNDAVETPVPTETKNSLSFWKNKKNLTIILAVFLILFSTLSTFLAVREVKKQQDLRSEASVEQNNIFVTPSQTVLTAPQSFEIKAEISEPVGFVHLELTFDPNLIQVTQDIQLLNSQFNKVKLSSPAEANSTGRIILTLALDPTQTDNPPQQAFSLAQFFLAPNTTTPNTLTDLGFDATNLQIVSLDALVIATTTAGSDLTLNPAADPIFECNSDCTTNTECQTADVNYICYQSQCRLDSNTSSATCAEAVDDLADDPVFECNSDCTTNTECQTADASYICYQSQCRLDSNTSSDSCAEAADDLADDLVDDLVDDPVFECNSDCTTNTECQTADVNYICYQSQCRLDSNTSSATCAEAVDDLADDQTDDPVFECNSSCTANTECQTADVNYICYQSQCRLDSNTSSATCAEAVDDPVDDDIADDQTDDSTNEVDDDPINETFNIATQPELPAVLPLSGSEDVLNWLKAGLSVLGIGAVLLLML